MPRALALIRSRLDRFGVLLSGLCAVHCVASIFLVSILGLGGSVLANPAIHEVGIALAIAIGLVTLGFDALHHGRSGPLLIGGSGLVLMAIALFVDHGLREALLTITGVSLLASAHLRNMREHRAHRENLHGAG